MDTLVSCVIHFEVNEGDKRKVRGMFVSIMLSLFKEMFVLRGIVWHPLFLSPIISTAHIRLLSFTIFSFTKPLPSTFLHPAQRSRPICQS